MAALYWHRYHVAMAGVFHVITGALGDTGWQSANGWARTRLRTLINSP